MEVFAMSKTINRVVSALLAGLMLASVCFTAVACKNDDMGNDSFIPETTTGTSGDNSVTNPVTGETVGEYTYKGYATALGTNWNPHTWEDSSDSSVLGYTTSPFVDMTIKDSVNGVYQWVYEMATEITDVTKDHKDDLTKYGSTLQSGKTLEETEAGFVFEIKLNPNAKWEDGTAINADDYIYSMQQLLNPKMRNYRANLYYAGESAVAGGLAFYNSEAPIYDVVVPAYGQEDTPDYSFDITASKVYLDLDSTGMTFSSYSFWVLCNDYGFINGDELDALDGEANAYGFVEITDENKATVLSVMDQYCAAFGLSIYLDAEKTTVNEEFFKEFLFYNTGTFGEKVEYDKVGCYKVDDYTIRYVTQTYIDFNYFLTSCTDTWLINKALYEGNMDSSGELITTKYGTSKDTYMSYGPYKIDSLQKGKQIVYVRNENWYGYQKDENGNLFSMTSFEVDGKQVQQYQTSKIVVDVMDDAAAKQAFLKGELSEWSPQADELSAYATSEQLYQADETYTMSFFFNTNVDDLKAMDTSKGNTNSVVLSNENFRKAFSLAINRAEYVTVTAGYKPAFSLMNSLYYYDVYNDPTSSYRQTEEAMKAIVNLYGVEYGTDGAAYKTLKEAHDSITGYNLDEAKKLMKTACDELVAAGLYTAGEAINIRIGWAKGALTADDNAQVAMMIKFINAAIEGSGFGAVTFEAIGNIDNRYDAVPGGEYAIGYGAWGGAAFYPFRNFQVYMDPDQYSINEAANYNPKVDTLTLNINGTEETMTWQAWSNCMIGSGKYADADFATKLSITSQLEEAFLKTYYRIPLCATTICSLASYQIKYYTQTYNIMYGYGGLRLLTYTYNDADWAKYVADQGGELKYE